MADIRTLYVEKMVAELLCLPFMRENVFHSARYLDGKNEKEVCDVLLVHRNEAIVISIKAQEKERDRTSTERWLKKNSAKAIQQLGGAYRTVKSREFWCEHGVWGRKQFRPGDVVPRHGIAVLESSFESLVAVDGKELDRLGSSAPITLMTVADFMTVAQYLRTWRDLTAYLDSRVAVLPEPDRRIIGAERALFGFYTANRDTFSGCGGIADAKIVTAGEKHIREGSAFRDRELRLAFILEQLIEQITASGDVDLPADAEDLRQHFDRHPSGKDVIRDDLCDLTIQERATLGEQIGHLCGLVEQDKHTNPLLYGAVRFDRHPDKVYVVVVGWEVSLGEASLSAMDLTLAACVHYEKKTGVLLLMNQTGPDIRFTIGRTDNVHRTIEMAAAGEEYFGKVRPRRWEEAR
jgi:hypothetical protein